MGRTKSKVMDNSTMTYDRYFALKLHALHEDDRAWILSRLESSTKEKIEPMLDELDLLGFDLDKADLEGVLTPSNFNVDDTFALNKQYIERVNNSSFQKITALFESDSPKLLSAFKRVYPWSWGSSESEKINHYQMNSRASSTQAVQQAMLRIVADELSKGPVGIDVYLKHKSSFSLHRYEKLTLKVRVKDFFKRFGQWAR